MLTSDKCIIVNADIFTFVAINKLFWVTLFWLKLCLCKKMVFLHVCAKPKVVFSGLSKVKFRLFISRWF